MTAHRRHLVLCGVGLVVAAGVLAATGANAAALGVLVAVLVCPVAMVVALRLLATPPRRAPHGSDGAERP